MSLANTNLITVSLMATASAETVARAHAAIDAFFGNGSAVSVGTTQEEQPKHTIENVAAAQAGAVELDANGLPWHADIHASTKTKTQKGEWTKRKGVDDKVVEAVTAQLRQMYPAPTAAAPAPAIVAAAAPAPSVPAVTLPTVNIAPKTEYQKLVEFIATNVPSKITQVAVDETFAKYNTSLAAMAGDEATSKAFLDAFTAAVGG